MAPKKNSTPADNLHERKTFLILLSTAFCQPSTAYWYATIARPLDAISPRGGVAGFALPGSGQTVEKLRLPFDGLGANGREPRICALFFTPAALVKA